MTLFQAKDTYAISGFCLTLCLLWIRPLPFRQWSAIDWMLCILVVYDLISCFYTPCTFPAIRTAARSISIFTAYLIIRRLSEIPHAESVLLKGSLLFIGIALLLAVVSFFIFRKSVIDAGFNDTYHFRFLFRPLGYVTNVWSEILLILLGWLCLIRRHAPVFIFLTLIALLLSFSRGAYLALGVFLCFWLLWVKPLCYKWQILVMALIAILTISITFPIETKTTMRMNATVSQRQSTQSRIDAVHSTLKVTEGNWLFGQGNGSYTFAIDRILNQDSTKPYTSFAPNLPVLVWVEKGAVGVGLYLLLGITVIWCVWKQRHKTMVQVIGCTFLAVGIKEMTQAVLLHTPFALLIVSLMLAYLQKKEKTEEVRCYERNMPFFGFLLICNLIFIGFSCLSLYRDSICKQSYELLKEGKVTEAAQIMQKVPDCLPYLIQKGLFYTSCYRQTQNTVYITGAEQALVQAIRLQPKDIHLSYLLACLCMQQNKWTDAYCILKQLVEMYPRNSLFLSALSEVYYQTSEKENALSYLIPAILYTPKLLDSNKITDLQQNDAEFYQDLCKHLSVIAPTDGFTPSDYARLGYIAYKLNHLPKAEIYLRKAVVLLPNLATPWRLLGEEGKYNLLNWGAFRTDVKEELSNNKQEITQEWLFLSIYKIKYKVWYGIELHSIN